MRRILIIVGIVILLGAIGFGVYSLFFSSGNGSITATPGGNQFPTGGEGSGLGEAPEVGVSLDAGEEVAPNLIRITEEPVAFGTLAFSFQKTITVQVGEGTTTETTTRTVTVPEIRYVERASGNIYAFNPEERNLTRLSNRTVPGIEDAAWLADGSMAFVRYLGEDDTVETYALRANGEEGYVLERGLDQVLVNGSSTVVTLVSSTNGSIATAARSDGTNSRTLFTSLLSSLRIYPFGASYAAVTKASAQSDGYGFIVRGGSFERILGPLKGLTILPSPSGKLVLYSYLSGNAVRAGLYDVTTHTSTALPVAALPEKCTWTTDETSVYCGIPRTTPTDWPDAWYQGATSFSDRIWRIDIGARVASLVVDPKTVAEVEIDAVSLDTDPGTDVLVFTNRKDGSLWMYDL